jgi:hypothetical protein
MFSWKLGQSFFPVFFSFFDLPLEISLLTLQLLYVYRTLPLLPKYVLPLNIWFEPKLRTLIGLYGLSSQECLCKKKRSREKTLNVFVNKLRKCILIIKTSILFIFYFSWKVTFEKKSIMNGIYFPFFNVIKRVFDALLSLPSNKSRSKDFWKN